MSVRLNTNVPESRSSKGTPFGRNSERGMGVTGQREAGRGEAGKVGGKAGGRHGRIGSIGIGRKKGMRRE